MYISRHMSAKQFIYLTELQLFCAHMATCCKALLLALLSLRLLTFTENIVSKKSYDIIG